MTLSSGFDNGGDLIILITAIISIPANYYKLKTCGYSQPKYGKNKMKIKVALCLVLPIIGGRIKQINYRR